MYKKITAVALAAMVAGIASATVITVDNYSTEQNGDTSGAVGNWSVQSFTPDVAGLGTLDTVTANSPLPATVYLTSASFLKAVSGTGSTAGNLYLNVYEGSSGTNGTFKGSSSNTIDVGNATGLDSLVWSFGNIALDSTAEIALVWSTTATAGDDAIARIQVARDSGGGFGNSYTGGAASINPDGSGAQAYETRFAVGLDTIPEPATFGLLGAFGGAILLIRRKMMI